MNRSQSFFVSRLGMILIGIAIVTSIFISQNAYAPPGGGGVQTGILSGKVFTPNLVGAAYATVVLTLGPNATITTQTASSGYYLISSVPTGSNYTLTATKSGYGPGVKTGISISAGRNTNVDIVLKKL